MAGSQKSAGFQFGTFDPNIQITSDVQIPTMKPNLPPTNTPIPKNSPQPAYQTSPQLPNQPYSNPQTYQGQIPPGKPAQSKKLDPNKPEFVPISQLPTKIVPQAFIPQQPFPQNYGGYGYPQAYPYYPTSYPYQQQQFQGFRTPPNPYYVGGGGIAPAAAPTANSSPKVTVSTRRPIAIIDPKTNQEVKIDDPSKEVKTEQKQEPKELKPEVKQELVQEVVPVEEPKAEPAQEIKPEVQETQAQVAEPAKPEPAQEQKSEPTEISLSDSGAIEGQKKKEKKKKDFPLEEAEEPAAPETPETPEVDGEELYELDELDELDQEDEEEEPLPYTIFVKYDKKVEYPPGVWEPKTKTGLRKYDFDFLKQFDFYDEKPAAFNPPPGFATPDKPRPKPSYNPNYHPRRQVGSAPSAKRVLPLPGGVRRPMPTNVKPLVQSENRWIRPSLIQPTDEEAKNEAIFRKYRGLLNKLTVERFDAISAEILKIEISSPIILRGLIHLIFDKATDEPNFAFMYANLCERVQKEYPNAFGNDITFRRLLLNKCQEEFEKRPDDEMGPLSEEEKKKMTEAEIEEYEYRRSKLKRRALGNITFIGELFKLGMLTEKIMHDCVTRLLGKGNEPDERDIECLSNLLKTVGKILDTPKAEKIFQSYFERIKSLSVSDRLSSRIRFMLMDTIDLRGNKWIPRREEAKAKKIEDVHKEAHDEELRKSSGGGTNRPESRRSSGRGSMPSLNSQLNNMRRTPSGSNAPKPNKDVADISKLQSYKENKGSQETGQKIFAPSTVFRKAAKPAPSGPNPNTNKFSALATEEPRSREPRSDNRSDSRSDSRSDNRSDNRSEKSAASREGKVVEKQVEQPVVALPPPMNQDKFNQTVTDNFEEYLQTKSEEDALQYMEELKGSEELFPEIVNTLMNFVIEKKSEQQALAVNYLSFLVSREILTPSHLSIGLNQSLEFLDDLIVDVPGTVDFFARLLVGLVKDGGLSPIFLNSIHALRTQESSKKLLASFLKQLALQKGEVEAADLIYKSVVDLPSILGVDFSSFFDKYDLRFLKRDTPLGLTGEFVKDSDKAIKAILERVDEKTQNSPSFGFVLMTAFLTDPAAIPNRADSNLVLRRFLSEKEDLQVQAIVACQYFSSENQLPDDLIPSLYESNVLTEGALNRWKSEQSYFPGKDDLLSKLGKFFEWLLNAEPEANTN